MNLILPLLQVKNVPIVKEDEFPTLEVNKIATPDMKDDKLDGYDFLLKLLNMLLTLMSALHSPCHFGLNKE